MEKKAFTPHLSKGVGFTLLELVVVILILGVLATLAFTQYGKMMENARQAEVKQVFGLIRKYAVAYRLANGTVDGMTYADYGIAAWSQDQIPMRMGATCCCQSSHYFNYIADIYSCHDPTICVYAYRCTAGGKEPQYSTSYYCTYTSNLVTGQDTMSCP
jgi:prepilin-type N-terminal cleavage/methylation domain-containing protein